MVAAIDDSGPIRAGKDVGGGKRTECPQHCGLGAQSHLFTVTQQACRKVQHEKGRKEDTKPG